MGATLWLITRNTIRGKPPSLGHGEFCEFVYVCVSFVHQKCYNYALTNLLFGLCRSMWIVDPLVICSSPHPEAPTCPFPPPRKCYKLWNIPQLFFLPLFSFLNSHLNLLRSLGVHFLNIISISILCFFKGGHLWNSKTPRNVEKSKNI